MVTDRITSRGSRKYVKCLIRDIDVSLKPEENVRQLWVARLISTYKYPRNRIRVEHPIHMGSSKKFADIAVMNAHDRNSPIIIVEVKKPTRKDGKEQLRSYCSASGCGLAVWSNGNVSEAWLRKEIDKGKRNHFISIPDIPNSSETIEDMLNEPWTINTLIDKEKQREDSGRTLRDLIRDMEDEVLANSGVDVFEEVFKLIFIKLFDEINTHENGGNLAFRNANSAKQVSSSIGNLFAEAKDRWPGVFSKDSKISLKSQPLQICVGSLEEWKLFNSNLDVIDDAFEYLVSKSAKGEKGQFFTPRWVTEMCVRMLNPKEKESIIDSACGSGGFLIHSIFHVWRAIMHDLGKTVSDLFSAEAKPPRCLNYVTKNIFGLDFDDRVVRVARCINLIAGDGQSNVLHIDSLDWNAWNKLNLDSNWLDVYGIGWTALRKFRHDMSGDEYRYMEFDMCMANPPFAGSITQSQILSLYDIAQKKTGTNSKMHRDILFVERNIDLLKPGGRIAIVLPEGRFNNFTDSLLREYVMKKCRILAVVGLHNNTFKPHTGIKTCVLFAQKWNDDESSGAMCPVVSDYEVFFANRFAGVLSTVAANQKHIRAGKGRMKRDSHGHMIVAHD